MSARPLLRTLWRPSVSATRSAVFHCPRGFASAGCCAAPESAAPSHALELREAHMRRHNAKGILRLGNADVQARIRNNRPLDAQLQTARVFYLPSGPGPEGLSRAIANVPLVAMPRDSLLVLQVLPITL